VAPFNIKPGMKFNYAGREYTVNGSVTLGVYEEGELYPWTEYMLESEDGDEFTLEFDDGVWITMRDWKPQQRMEPEHMRALRDGGFVTVDGIKMRIKCKAMAHLQSVDGEMDLAFPGETQWEYIDANAATELFSAEWTRERVNWVRGKRISHAEVARGFGQTAYSPPSIGQSYPSQPYQPGPQAKDLLGLAMISLGLALLALLVGCSTSSSGKVTASGQTKVINPDIKAVSFGPIQVDGNANPHQLSAFVVPINVSAMRSGTAPATPVLSTHMIGASLNEGMPDASTHFAKPDGYSPAPVGGLYAEGAKFRATSGPRYVVVTGNNLLPGTQVGFQLKQGIRGAGWLYFFALGAGAAGVILLLVGLGHIRRAH